MKSPTKYFQIKTLAANAADALAVAANGDGGGAVFELAQPDTMFIPYGTYPHKVGRQVFDRAAAEAMVAANGSLLATFGKWLSGRNEFPIYVGHPDIAGSKDYDKKAYGWGNSTGMIAGNDGLTIPVRWSDPGREMVEQGHYRFYSPAWWLQKTPRGLVPVGMKSVGLTNDPNIPVPALANESEALSTKHEILNEETEEPTEPTETEDPMNENLLTALGLAPDATLEDALAAITTLQSAAAAAKEETDEVAGKLTAAQTAKANAETSLAENVVALAAARAALEIAANYAVAGAVSAGQVTPSEAPAKTAEMLASNDLSAALAGLAVMPAKIKTTSITGPLGSAKARLVAAANDQSAAAREERATLVANELERVNPKLSTGERKRLAWERAQAKYPEQFGKSTAAPV